MKKVVTASIAALGVVLSVDAFANQGYNGPAAAPVTVKDALNMSDDAPVVMVGKIEQSLGGEKYTFKDSTGSVTVEIDNEDWAGSSVNENDTVEIHGEVDKDFTTFEIDVDRVVKK